MIQNICDEYAHWFPYLREEEVVGRASGQLRVRDFHSHHSGAGDEANLLRSSSTMVLVGGCFGSECIDHDVVQMPRKLP